MGYQETLADAERKDMRQAKKDALSRILTDRNAHTTVGGSQKPGSTVDQVRAWDLGAREGVKVAIEYLVERERREPEASVSELVNDLREML